MIYAIIFIPYGGQAFIYLASRSLSYLNLWCSKSGVFKYESNQRLRWLKQSYEISYSLRQLDYVWNIMLTHLFE